MLRFFLVFGVLIVLFGCSSSLILSSDSPSLKTDGYLGGNVICDPKTGIYWWIFSDKIDNTVKLAKTVDLIHWEVEYHIDDADSACLRKFGSAWYIFYGSESNIWMIKSQTINKDYSFPFLVLNSDIGKWDSIVFGPDIVWNDGLYYLFYTGQSDSICKIGYAISHSASGPFIKYQNNPVLQGQTALDYWNSGKEKASYPCVEKIGDWFVIQHTASSINERDSIGWAITKNFLNFYCWESSIFDGKNSDWSSEGVSRGGLFKIGEQWYLSYSGKSNQDKYGKSGMSKMDLDVILKPILLRGNK